MFEETRLTYNCAHLRSTKGKSDSFSEKFVCAKHLCEHFLSEHLFLGELFWVKIFLSEYFG